jgi:alkaline phosphatase
MLVASAVAVLAMVIAPPIVEGSDDAKRGGAKNVIVMVPDGCQVSIATAARWYKGGNLYLDRYVRGMMKTHMANSVITGSAAAATAFATGHKTTARFLGVGPSSYTDYYNGRYGSDGEVGFLTGYEPTAAPYAPVASVLEGAKLLEKATGLVSTSRITHATPAAYAVHIHDRGMDNEIMEHLVYNNVDVVFGGAERHLLPSSEGGRRTDGENLKQVLLDRGYQYVTTADDLAGLSSGKAWGMFASSHMEADIDRAEYAPDQPSLAEMTAKAIDLLSQDPDGFFLMVEGSQVDWAGHNNDPIFMITDMLAFDEAFKEALDFAQEDGETLVLVFPDHDTGGLAIGHYWTEHHYTLTTVEDVVEPLNGMRITSYRLESKIEDLGGPTIANLQSAIQEWWGLAITEDDAQAILDYQDAMGVYLNYAIAFVISERYTYFGWTTHGHTGTDVPIWAYGPGQPRGTLDNVQVARRTAAALDVNLNATQQVLFVDLAKHFPGYNLDKSDAENPVVKVGDCELPVSKDFMTVNGVKTAFQLPGLTVHAPATDKVYVSLPAIAMIDAFNAGKAFGRPSRAAIEQRLRQLAVDVGVDPEFAVSLLD